MIAILLTGGGSQRMGRDKAFVDWAGKPLWRHQLETLQQLEVDRIVISARPSQRFENLPDGVTVSADSADLGGALPALATILGSMDAAEMALIIPVDSPDLTAEFLQRGFPADSPNGVVYQLEGRLQPLPVLLPTVSVETICEQVESGDLSLRGLCQKCVERGFLEICDLDPVDAGNYRNVNRPEDFG